MQITPKDRETSKTKQADVRDIMDVADVCMAARIYSLCSKEG